MLFPSKLPHVGTTIFSTMSALALQHGAINLGQGFPDYPMDEKLTDLVNRAMKDHHNQYAPMPGYGPLLEVIGEKVKKSYGTSLQAASQITVTPGGTYAIYCAMTAVLQPGDEVILFEPAYDSYIPNIELNGGVAIPVKLNHPDYQINWEVVREKVNEKTRMIVLNSPHNPTGSVLSETDIQSLRDIVKDSKIIIISDEVYEHLIFGGRQHLSILKYPDLMERSFVSFSFGKVYHCTGWKLGYSISSPEFTTEFRKVHQFNCFSSFTPTQVALSTFLQDESSYNSLGVFLQKKQQSLEMQMANTPLKPLPSFGSYFQLYSFEGLTQETEQELAIRLTKEAGVTTIPTSAFYSDGTNNQVLRFCFAKKEDTLAEAAFRLNRFFERS